MSPIILGPSSPAPPPAQGMSLGDAQSELAARGFDYLTASRMTIMLNDAKNTFEDTWEFPWLYGIASGPAPLDVSDLKYVLTVKTASDDELLGTDLRILAQDSTDLSLPGTPERWYLTDDVGDRTTLRTWPTSDAALTVVYIRASPELSDVSDGPLIPARYHPIWIDLAVIQAYQDSDNFAGAQALRADVNQRLQDVIERYETRNRQHAEIIAIRNWSEDD